jgi:hypothetical protein
VPPRALAITRAALADLGLKSEALIGMDPGLLVDEHKVIRAFVEQRSQDAQGREATLGVKPTTWNLHVGTWRAVTWYEERSGICWLLAATATHNYRTFEQRAAAGTLLPTPTDRADLEVRTRPADGDFWELAIEDALQLIERVQANPNTEVHATLGDELDVSLYHAVDDTGGLTAVHITCVLPPRGNRQLDEDICQILAGMFLDSDDGVTWWAASHPARPQGRHPNELIISWHA